MALLPRWWDYDAGNEVHELNDDSRRSGMFSVSMMERSKTRRRSVSSLGLVLFAMLGCGEPRKPPEPQIHDRPADAATANLHLPASSAGDRRRGSC